MSYDAQFESVEVPERVRRMRREVLERNRGRNDDVEFTFTKEGGRWKHLGEATLWNRCKSHMDVAERWYPEIWTRIKAEQREREREEQEVQTEIGNGRSVPNVNLPLPAATIEAH